MSAPDFRTFGVNTYRGRFAQHGDTVTLTPRLWLAALTFAAIAMATGAFTLLPVLYRHAPITLPRIAGLAATAGLLLAAVLYATYRERVSFHFGTRRYTVTKGFLWNPTEVSGDFADIVCVTVKEARFRRSGPGMPDRMVYDIGIDCRTANPTFDIWQAQSEEQARHIAETLARAFGCRIEWKKAPTLGGAIGEAAAS